MTQKYWDTYSYVRCHLTQAKLNKTEHNQLKIWFGCGIYIQHSTINKFI